MLSPEDILVDELEDNLNNFEGENDGNEGEGAPEEAEEDANKEPVKRKRVVRNPQPKLNEQTLKGARGLTALPSYFDRVKYKGKGYEEQDLSVILKTYEYWCHRLFPKYPFDDCIAKIEKLGFKKAVVTHVKKIRFDMINEDEPILNNDHVESDPEVEDNTNDQFNHLFESVDISAPIEITEEQQERIRLNRERAEKLRQEKLNTAREPSGSHQQEPTGSQSQNTDTFLNEGSSHHSWQSESEEEDMDSIFDKIKKFNGGQQALRTENQISETEDEEFLTNRLDFQTGETAKTHLSERTSSESESPLKDDGSQN